MNNIYQVNKEFDFSQLTLANPNGLQGGAYFTKLKMNNGPLYVQLPRSFTKQGIVKTEKKIYADLLFSYDDTDVVEWLVALEERVQEIIYEKRDLWFQQELELDDIQTAFNSGIRSYKGNKYLIRTNIITPKHINYKPNIQIFDEDENPKSIEEITSSKPIISIIEISGVKFTSRNFQLDIYLKQIMVLDNKPLFNSCMIKKSDGEDNNATTNTLDQTAKIPVLKPDGGSDEIIDTDSDNNSESLEKETATVTEQDTDVKDTVTSDVETKEIKETKEVQPEEVDIDKKDLERVDTENTQEQNSLEETSKITDNETVPETLPEMEDSSPKNLENTNLIEEIDIGDYKDLGNNDSISLKQPSDVYIEIYKEAKEKAKKARIAAIKAYLEAKKVKKTYLLDDYIDSDSDSEDLFGSFDEESLNEEVNEELNNKMVDQSSKERESTMDL